MDILNPIDSQQFFNQPSVYKIVLFYASWCPHCTAVAPVIRKLNCLNSNMSNQIKVALVEQKNNQTLASLFGVEIKGFPTIYLFMGKGGQNGKVVSRTRDISQLRTLPQLTQFISQYLKINFTEEEKKCLMTPMLNSPDLSVRTHLNSTTERMGGSTKNIANLSNMHKGYVANQSNQKIATNFFVNRPINPTYNKNPCPFMHAQPVEPIRQAAGGKIIVNKLPEPSKMEEKEITNKVGGSNSNTKLETKKGAKEVKETKQPIELCVIC